MIQYQYAGKPHMIEAAIRLMLDKFDPFVNKNNKHIGTRAKMIDVINKRKEQEQCKQN